MSLLFKIIQTLAVSPAVRRCGIERFRICLSQDVFCGRVVTQYHIQGVSYNIVRSACFWKFVAQFFDKWFKDNQATAKIVEVGSMKFEKFSHCFDYKIDLYIECIPRELTREQASRLHQQNRDCDDWQITQGLFTELNDL